MAVETHHVVQTAVRQRAFLDAFEVGKRIVLHCIRLKDRGARQDGVGRGTLSSDGAVIRQRWKVRRRHRLGQVERRSTVGRTVAVVDEIRARQRQILLIGLPTQAHARQLIRNGLADRLGGRHRLHTVDVGQEIEHRRFGLVPVVDRFRRGVHAFARDRANNPGRIERIRRVAAVVVRVRQTGVNVGHATAVVPVR